MPDGRVVDIEIERFEKRAAFTAAESFRIHTAGCDLRRRIDTR
jgi:hypothetical protein